MQVKVFEATDMAAGLRKIRRELGPDALILSTRTIKSGKMGVLGRKTLEITAAVDNHWPAKSDEPGSFNGKTLAQRAYTDTAQTSNQPPQAPNHGYTDNPVETMTSSTSTKESVLHENPALRQEFDELKNMVKNLAGELSRIETQQSTPPESAPYNPLAALEQKLRVGKKNNRIEEILLSNGINQQTANIISGFAQEHLLEKDLEDEQKIYSFLHETIADIFNIDVPEFSKGAHQKRMAFIGPTGVGKTTTLAKIAAKYLATQSHSIALITIDTYRIAAVEQLKVYGEIMHLPVEVVITPQQLVNALEKHKDKELILIDTAGRSLEEIQSFFTEDLQIENHLVLSATTRDNELLETLKSFKPFAIHSTIFTKTDECTNLGVLLNTQIQNSSPLSYITNGQRVPEDIMEAEKRILAQLIVPPPTE